MFKHFLSILVVMFLLSCSQSMNTASIGILQIDGAELVGTSTCLECHDDFETDGGNVHAKIKSFEAFNYGVGCESCHGLGSMHSEEEDPDLIVCFGEHGVDGETANAVCLQCHTGNKHMAWLGSEHQQNDVYCLDCHTIHNNTEKNLLVNDDENILCAKCHQDIKAKGYLMSHHPYPEGKMTCSDCHEVHGTSNLETGMLKTDETVNDLCLSCHARYQGPFVFEHEPVIDDCCSCHDPHGTVANNLLIQQEPFLCLQCHEAHFHTVRTNTPNRTGLTQGVIDPNTGQQVGSDQLQGNHSWQGTFLTKCTTCHQYVHGSDLPSQTVPGQGGALLR